MNRRFYLTCYVYVGIIILYNVVPDSTRTRAIMTGSCPAAVRIKEAYMNYGEKLAKLQELAAERSSHDVSFAVELEPDIDRAAEYDGGEFFVLTVNGKLYDSLVDADDVMFDIASLANGAWHNSEKTFSVGELVRAVRTYRSDRDAWDFVSSLTGLTKEQMKKMIRDMDAAENG